ncbi:MAG: hypothetical protein FWH37_09465 [Candidatus Bathyarchaeota archaeon]|nr:hypothetical protein [Candidatus Termiticorpusculum sp.]
MKCLLKNKVFISLFISLTLILTSVLSIGALSPTAVYAAEYPTTPSMSAEYLLALETKLSTYPGANIDWYLANPEANEFYISTPAELFGMAYLVNTEIEDPPLSGWVYNVAFEGKTINLVNNIDLSTPNPAYTNPVYTYGEQWIAMGWGGFDDPDTGPGTPGYASFKGVFDGNGYTITGLADYSLFGFISNAIIKNLSTSGTVKNGTGYVNHYIAGVVNHAKNSILSNLKSNVCLVVGAPIVFPAGGIVSEAFGDTTIIGCEFSGTLDNTGKAAPVGGIVGSVGFPYFDTIVTVKNCVNYADLTAYYKGGGIVGGTTNIYLGIKSANIVIENCVNYGDITDDCNANYFAYGTGGILGASSFTQYNPVISMSVTVDVCANYGTINGNLNNAGGIVGYIQQGNSLSISNSYNRDDVTSQAASGGIVGHVDNADGAVIENTYDTGVVTGANAGGFIGLVNSGTVSSVNNYYLDTSAAGAVNSDDYIGVTAKTDAEMKNPTFAAQLGNAYTAITDDYPVLSWQTNSNPTTAIVTLNGDASIIAGNDATYTVSVNNVNKLATVTLWVEVDGTYLTSKTFKGLNNFNILNDEWTQNGNICTGRITLINLDNNGVSSSNNFDIFELVFSSNSGQFGIATVKLVNVDLSGYNNDVDKAVYIDSSIANNLVQTVINQYFSLYDTNKDGKIDQLDLTTAQLFYMVQEGDVNWDAAKASDVNNDGRVDIEDFIPKFSNVGNINNDF